MAPSFCGVLFLLVGRGGEKGRVGVKTGVKRYWARVREERERDKSNADNSSNRRGAKRGADILSLLKYGYWESGERSSLVIDLVCGDLCRE